MSADALTLAGLVLAREPSGERHLKLTLLSAEHGAVLCLLRASSKPTAPMPDLFDTAEVSLDASKSGGGPRFASEYRVLRREPSLGGDYARLAAACRFALIVTKNPASSESAESLHALCVEVVVAFAQRPRPDVTLFKALWRLAREEGYPVREHWWTELGGEDRAVCTELLRQPLDTQETTPVAVTRLTRSLERWLERECQFVLPEEGL